MASQTDVKLRKMQIYCIFVRNHTKKGTLKAIEPDLDRIKSLGTDCIWLMPIFPIGKKDRKGKLGSPYSIKDYRAIDPKLGTWQDFLELVKSIHDRGMKVMLDIVYNHTSRDSVLLQVHPEWFLHDHEGNLYNKNEDWTDVAELDYSHKALWNYQIETLKHYAKIVDGFRCDVAPQVPIEFWKEARKEVAKVNPKTIWLAESTGPDYIKTLNAKGYHVSSDAELYSAFDMTYDYDIDQTFRKYVKGDLPLKKYVEALNTQGVIYPSNYIKMRALENHDQERAHSLFINENDVYNWTAFSEFQKGSTLVYAGQEYGFKHTPSLFDKDKLDWDDKKMNLSSLIFKMHQMSQSDIQVSGTYKITALENDIVEVTYKMGDIIRIGIFTLKGMPGEVPVALASDSYTNMIDNSLIKVKDGIVMLDYDPIIIQGKNNE
ncbi:alpha-amylase family glycosyl hydrolase [Companilactobacillus pabuli]|uniref:alpha-amylase family glycosyl hydrolase n=1 Tax=Companilactobacillus pabuli TaxID=2714036 RepID=UPI00241812E5|nr:alpha-amylase family glycosyl hydrolase [Companilactobacillus pabuli]MDG5112992.1 alpha-amylase family glycosyl hydrolase [Companilactobacillus pabuli]